MLNCRVLRVLIASPGDCQEERDEMVRALHAWNYDHAEHFNVYLWPWRWEENSYSTYGMSGQETLNEQLVRRADLVVAFLRNKLGTPTEKYESGTVEEIEECRQRGLFPAVHFLTGAQASPSEEEAQRLEAYRKQLEEKKFYYKPFTSTADAVRQAMSSVVARVYELSQESPSEDEARPATEERQPISEPTPAPASEVPAEGANSGRPNGAGSIYTSSILLDTQRGRRRLIGNLSGMQGLVHHDWIAEVSEFENGWEIKNTSGMPLELRRWRVVADYPGSRIEDTWAKDVPARVVQPNERIIILDSDDRDRHELEQARVRVEYSADGVFLEGVVPLEAYGEMDEEAVEAIENA